jgi:hypothetical protein
MSKKNDKKKKPVYFGGPLPEGGLPEFVIDAIEYIEKEGLKTEGIFRIATGQIELGVVVKKIEKGEKIEYKKYSIHTASNIVKKYFREITEPLLTYDQYGMFIAAESIPEEEAKFKLIKNIIAFLPEKNKKQLSYLCIFLHELSLYEEYNKMSPSNLAVVFAPNLLKSKEDYSLTNDFLKDQQSSIGALTTLIIESDYFFLDGKLSEKKEISQETDKNEELEQVDNLDLNQEDENLEEIDEKIEDLDLEMPYEYNVADLDDVFKKINEESWEILPSVDINEDEMTAPSFEFFSNNNINFRGEEIL